MAQPTVMGMDLFTFIMSIISVITTLWGLGKMIKNGLPTQKYLETVEMFVKTERFWNEFLAKGTGLSPKREARMVEIVKRLKDDLKSLVFVAQPSRVWDILRPTRVYFKRKQVMDLASDVNRLRVGIKVLATRREHINIERAFVARDGNFFNQTGLEKQFTVLADAYINSFGDDRKEPEQVPIDSEAEEQVRVNIRSGTDSDTIQAGSRSTGQDRENIVDFNISVPGVPALPLPPKPVEVVRPSTGRRRIPARRQ